MVKNGKTGGIRGGGYLFVKCKIKEYPDGNMKAYVYKERFPVGNDLPSSGSGSVSLKKDMTVEEMQKEESHQQFQNLRRVKNKINDYCMSNEFELFVTLTFKEDREDNERCFSKLDNWLRYMRKKYGKFDYILIPEPHKDGCLHFHGVFKNFGGDLTDSGKFFKEKIIYNIDSWRYGFSTATVIVNRQKTASYITKYVTKQMLTTVEKGKKKYWNSRGLRKPVIHHLEENPFINHKPSFSNDFVEIYEFYKK